MPKALSITNAAAGRQAGFSVVEVLLAAVVFGMLVVALVGAIIYGRSSGAESGTNQRATLLADEGIEAARNIANASYANLVDGTYGIAQSGNQWAFSGSSDTDGFFTRTVTVAADGTNRKLITSTVTWPQTGGGTANVVLTTRLVNWEATMKLWTNAANSGSAQPTGTTSNLKVDTSGNYAYVVRNSTSNNLAIVNMSNPAAPSVVTNMTVSNTPTNVAIGNGYLYITTSTNTTCLLIYSLSNPTSPSLVRTLSFTGTSACRGVYVRGNYAYVVRAASTTTSANEFNIVDATTPASASVVGGYNNDIQMNEVWVSGNYAYVATSSTTQEMLVIGVTTPTAPALAATYNPATTLTALTITGYGETVFLGMSTTLDAISITNPTVPTRLGTFTAASTINDIDVDITGLFAFLGTANTSIEFQAVNIGTPASMSLARSLNLTGTFVLNGVAYNRSLDTVAGASSSTTAGFVVINRN